MKIRFILHGDGYYWRIKYNMLPACEGGVNTEPILDKLAACCTKTCPNWIRQQYHNYQFKDSIPLLCLSVKCKIVNPSIDFLSGNLRDRNDTAGEFALREKERGWRGLGGYSRINRGITSGGFLEPIGHFGRRRTVVSMTKGVERDKRNPPLIC